MTDHTIPARERPDLMYEWKNLGALCHAHHSGLKQEMENHAVEVGQVDLLPEWCFDPEKRPRKFRMV